MVRVLVTPATAESGLEVMASLSSHRDFTPVGGSTDPDYARALGYTESHYIPPVEHPDFTSRLESVVKSEQIDALLPCHDEFCFVLRNAEPSLPTRLIGHPARTLDIVRSKRATYRALADVVVCPVMFESLDAAQAHGGPMFVKPDRGQGSRGVWLASDSDDLVSGIRARGLSENDFFEQMTVCEFLTGEETTVDCFSGHDGTLLFAGQRRRAVVRSGIAVHTFQVFDERIHDMVHKINVALAFKGPWFAQFRSGPIGPTLLEIGPRISGSSGIWRSHNVNLAVLSVHQALGDDVSVLSSGPLGEGARRLTWIPTLSSLPLQIAMDYDDTLVIDGEVNRHAIALLATAKAVGVETVLVSRHARDLHAGLEENGLAGLFNRVHHLHAGEPKSAFVRGGAQSWFIDDAFSERLEVEEKCGARSMDPSAIPLMLEAVLNYREAATGKRNVE